MLRQLRYTTVLLDETIYEIKANEFFNRVSLIWIQNRYIYAYIEYHLKANKYNDTLMPYLIGVDYAKMIFHKTTKYS